MSNNNYRLDKHLIKVGKHHLINVSDPNLNYLISPEPQILEPEPELLEPEPAMNDFNEIISTEPLNYSIGSPEPDVLNDTRKNLSYLQVKTLEEGVEWYRDMDPMIPDELLILMSRWSFGDLSTITKKQIKNEHKKAVKKGKKKTDINSIKIKRGPCILTF
tara:strand:- start:77 stop:559 length:483 start_codon:yes stop_codon:yes gene_type:complete